MTPHHELLKKLNHMYHTKNCEQAVQTFKDFVKNEIPENEDMAEEIFLDVIAMTKLWDIENKESNCYLIRGLAYQELEQYDKAVMEFEQAIRLK